MEKKKIAYSEIESGMALEVVKTFEDLTLTRSGVAVNESEFADWSYAEWRTEKDNVLVSSDDVNAEIWVLDGLS